MKKFLNTHMMISLHLLVIALVISTAAWVIHDVKADSVLQVEENIERQAELMSRLAELTGRNGADAVVSNIITDCPNRAKFEQLLVRLGSLSYKDLLQTQQLFESCGSFYAERKALMVSRLVREHEVLEDNILLLNTIDEDNTEDYNVLVWGELIRLEQERSDLLNEQVTIQRDIISQLITGDTPSGSTISTEVARAQDVNDLIGVLNAKTTKLREELITD